MSKPKSDADYQAQLRSATTTGAAALQATTTRVAATVAGGQDTLGDGNPITYCQGDIATFEHELLNNGGYLADDRMWLESQRLELGTRDHTHHLVDRCQR